MLDAKVDTRGIAKKIDAARIQAKRIAARSLQSGLDAAVAETPHDTGYLAASWYVVADGVGEPAMLNQLEAKRGSDDARPFRFRVIGGREVDIYNVKFEEFGTRAEFAVPTGLALAALQKQLDNASFQFPSLVEFRNSAPYASVLNDSPYRGALQEADNEHQGWGEKARLAAGRAVRAKAGSLTPTAAARAR